MAAKHQKKSTNVQRLMGETPYLVKSVPDLNIKGGIYQIELASKSCAHVPNLNTQLLPILILKSLVKFRLIVKTVHYG